MNLIADAAPMKGFEDQVLDATACFGIILEAISRPARVRRLPVIPQAPEGLSGGSVAVLLTLADMDTPVWLAPECDTPKARAHLRFHVGCPIVDVPSDAVFAVLPVTGELGAIDAMPVGSAEYPDRSATVILQGDGFIADAGPIFSGPGINGRRQFDVMDRTPALWPRVAANNRLFPCGVDWIFTAPGDLAALPRTTEVEL